MTVDLIVFDISNFDNIFSINFLCWYEAKIDYRKKKVWLYLDKGDEFIFYKGRLSSIIINSVKMRKILSKG